MTNAAYRCPDCLIELLRVDGVRHYAWACPTCQGTALTLAVLRQSSAVPRFDAIWNNAHRSAYESRRPCPSCASHLHTLTIAGSRGDVDLDACRICSLIWFDSTDLEQLDVSLAKSENNEVRRAKAQLDVSLIRETKAEVDKIESFRDLVGILFEMW